MYYSYQKHTVLLEQCSKYSTTQSTTVTTRMALLTEVQQYSFLQHYNIMKLPLIKQTKYKLLLSKLKHSHGLLTYSPPRHKIEAEDYKNFFHHLGNKFIAGGDWNAKHTNWGFRLTIPKGRNLLQSITNCNCSYISTGEPTYWPSDPNKRPDLLDFFIYKSIAKNCIQIEPNWDISSDHTPIIAKLSTHTIHKPETPRLTSPKTDWNAFRTHIDASIKFNNKLKQPDDIDEAVNYITCLIQEAAWRSTPPEIPGKDPISLTPPHIRAIVTEKRRARNRWQRNCNPIDKRVYNQLTRQLKAALQDTRNATFETYINTLSKEDHSIWKATKQFKKPITHVPPIL